VVNVRVEVNYVSTGEEEEEEEEGGEMEEKEITEVMMTPCLIPPGRMVLRIRLTDEEMKTGGWSLTTGGGILWDASVVARESQGRKVTFDKMDEDDLYVGKDREVEEAPLEFLVKRARPEANV
jgi:hypothetical protein